MKKLITMFLLLASTSAFATTNRILDGTAITAGSPSNLLTLPQTTDTLLGRATTDTLINKTLSGGSNTFSNLSAGSITSGTLGVGNGGTGATSLTLNSLLLGNGTSSVQFVTPGTTGNILTSNGTTWISSAPLSTGPSLNGGSAGPQIVTAAGGVSLASIGTMNMVWVIGSLGAVTVTATPSITACTADGQILRVIGTDDIKTVTLQDNAGLTGSNLQINGNWVGKKYSTLTLHCDITLSAWVEDSRR